jgi:uncharacterized membrane protein YiaA
MVTDWKTTLTALVTFAATMLAQFKVITLTADQQVAIVTVGLLIVGLFAADAKKKEVK